jgi:alkaline phosphatase D
MNTLKVIAYIIIICTLSSACRTSKSSKIEGIEELLTCKVNYLPIGNSTLNKISFGSCQSQDGPIPTLSVIIENKPDLFIYLGDNIYGDTENMKILAGKYSKLCANNNFKNLAASSPILATWDDHDYGANDAGREYPQKENSKNLFLEFWGEPKDSDRYKHEGIYTSYYIGPEGKKVQIILLDTRTFRSPLLKANGKPYRNDYRPNNSKSATILGEAQWKWLAEELEKPADLRIIGSSNQFGIEYNGYESWANFPLEREKMLNLIKEKKAEHLVFISGDVHYAELSKIESDGLYPIYDLTSSGLNRDWPHIEPNKNRVGKACKFFNFGTLEIDWEQKKLNFVIIESNKELWFRKSINFSDLEFSQKK